MSDFLIEIGANPTARNLINKLGLPLPMPQKLARATGPWEARPLENRTIVVGAATEATIFDVLAPALAEAGCAAVVEGPVGAGTPWAAAAEAWGRPATTIEAGAAAEGSVHALILDATGVANVDDLHALKDFFQPRMRQLARNGRLIVLGRPHTDASSIAESAARRALEGFVRAAAKEVGAKGTTANLIAVSEGKEAAVVGPLRWLLTPRSAFLSGQPFVLTQKRAPSEVPFTRPLEGKVALVTGAARGIGAATVATLAREGAHVICLDRPDDAEPLAEVARKAGGTPLGLDVTSPGAAERILAAADALGGLDILVHNAGVTRDKTLANMDDGRWDLTLDVNLRAILTLTDAIAPKMNSFGRVIALSSVAGIAGNFGQTNYAASKAGVIGFIEAAAPTLARRGITVNGIAPGFIETRLTAAIPVATREGGRRLSALVQGGLPVDIAEAVTFLASPGSYGMTGRVVRVCGGAFIGA